MIEIAPKTAQRNMVFMQCFLQDIFPGLYRPGLIQAHKLQVLPGVANTWANENERQITSGIAAPQCGNYDDALVAAKSDVGRTGVRRSQEDKRNKNGISF